VTPSNGRGHRAANGAGEGDAALETAGADALTGFWRRYRYGLSQ
jgi:hypothetical protein